MSEAPDRARYEAAYESALKTLGRRQGLITKKPRRVERWYETRSPSDRSVVVGEFPLGTAQDLAEALAEAWQAFPSWRSLHWSDRVDLIRRAAENLESRRYEIAPLLTVEIGKTWTEALYDVQETIDVMRYYADAVERADGFIVGVSDGTVFDRSVSVMVPYGPWVIITPFNFPMALCGGPASAALITGNTVVLKPSERAPLSAFVFADALFSAGVPAGVVSVVTAGPVETATVIEQDRSIAGVGFTGSATVGRRIITTLAPRSVPVVAEMGSKNPALIAASANLDDAACGVARSAFSFAGQKCSSNSRVYVDRSVYDEFVGRLLNEANRLSVGQPDREDTDIGPVISETSVNRFRESVHEATRAGGKVECGGKRLDANGLSNGLFLNPTVITGLDANHRLLREELFVPLTVVVPVDSLQAGIHLANETEYGLAAGLYAASQIEIDEFVENIEAGVLYINRRSGATTGARVGVQTFGGWKGSGSTGRNAYGPYYLLNFLREQSQTYGTHAHVPSAR